MTVSNKLLAVSMTMGMLVGLFGCNQHGGDLGSSNTEKSRSISSENLPPAEVVTLKTEPKAPEPKAPEAPVAVKAAQPDAVQAQYVSTRTAEVPVNATVDRGAAAIPAENVAVPAQDEKAQDKPLPTDLQVLLDEWQHLPANAKAEIISIIKTSAK